MYVALVLFSVAIAIALPTCHVRDIFPQHRKKGAFVQTGGSVVRVIVSNEHCRPMHRTSMPHSVAYRHTRLLMGPPPSTRPHSSLCNMHHIPADSQLRLHHSERRRHSRLSCGRSQRHKPHRNLTMRLARRRLPQNPQSLRLDEGIS